MGGGRGGGGGGVELKGHGQLMALLNGWNKKIGKLMVGTRNGGFAADGRPGEKSSGPANFPRVRTFPGRKLLPAHYDTCKTEG